MEFNPTTIWQTPKVRLSMNLHRIISFPLIRLSSTYLKSERMKLSKQRNLLRIIQNESQTHYSSEKIFLNHLPSSIPSAIPIGSRVIGKFALYSNTHRSNISNISVRLFHPSEMGLYHGIVVSHEGLYQISFDHANIGILNIKDIDLMVGENSFFKYLNNFILSV